MERKANEFIEDDQFGFTKGKGTREAIAAICILGERKCTGIICVYGRFRESI